MDVSHVSIGYGVPLLLGLVAIVVVVLAVARKKGGVGAALAIATVVLACAVFIGVRTPRSISTVGQPVRPIPPIPPVHIPPIPPLTSVAQTAGPPAPSCVTIASGPHAQIVIDGLKVTPDVATELASGNAAVAQVARDEALAETQDSLALRLGRYFERLIQSPEPAGQELRALRDSLQRISVDQRRKLAEQAAELRESIVEQINVATTQSVSDSSAKRKITISIDPDEIRKLAVDAAEQIPDAEHLTTGQKIAGTAGAVLLAAIILKVATRRHSGVRYL